jgi:hypothetical protein
MAGPGMPEIDIKVRINGVPATEQARLQWKMRLRIGFEDGQRDDVVYWPEQAWQQPAAGVSEWTTTPEAFCGGQVRAQCRVTIDGQQLQAESLPLEIAGVNPQKKLVREVMATTSMQGVAYYESRFNQFSDSISLEELNRSRTGSFRPLSRSQGRYGIGQLDAPLDPQHLWNWRDNATETKRRLTGCRNRASVYQAQVQNGLPWDDNTGGSAPNQVVPFPTAPAFTEDQLDLEVWSRYKDACAITTATPPPGGGSVAVLAVVTRVRRLPMRTACGQCVMLFGPDGLHRAGTMGHRRRRRMSRPRTSCSSRRSPRTLLSGLAVESTRTATP